MDAPQAVSRNPDLFRLPRYRGPLGPAPWSGINLTPDLEQALRAAALRSCPVCGGCGYSKVGDKVHPCTCINRRVDTGS